MKFHHHRACPISISWATSEDLFERVRLYWECIGIIMSRSNKTEANILFNKLKQLNKDFKKRVDKIKKRVDKNIGHVDETN